MSTLLCIGLLISGPPPETVAEQQVWCIEVCDCYTSDGAYWCRIYTLWDLPEWDHVEKRYSLIWRGRIYNPESVPTPLDGRWHWTWGGVPISADRMTWRSGELYGSSTALTRHPHARYKPLGN